MVAPDDRCPADTSAIRRRAGVRLLISAAAGLPVVLFFMWLTAHGYKIFGPGMGAPLLPVLVFSTEVITGREFGDLARRWDELKGWQRGVLGTAIVLCAGTILIMAGALIAVALVRE